MIFHYFLFSLAQKNEVSFFFTFPENPREWSYKWEKMEIGCCARVMQMNHLLVVEHLIDVDVVACTAR